MENKRVYIIVPCYNVEKYIEKCLNCIFNQTYKNIEVICIDDGSIDTTRNILKHYSALHKNIKVITKNNGGLSSARNAGLRCISNLEDAYIAFVDADDWIDSGYIATLVSLLEKNDVDIVCSSFMYESKSNSSIYKKCGDDIVLEGREATKILLEDETIQSHACTKLFKGYLWCGVLFDESLSYMEDQAIVFKTFYSSKKILFTNYCGYHYNQCNQNSLTKQKNTNKKIISGLKAYFYPCYFFSELFDDKILASAAKKGLAAAFLTLFPHYRFHQNSNDDFFVKKIISYIKKYRVIQNYTPSTRKEMYKKRLYLTCPIFYRFLFPLFRLFFRILHK